MKMKRRSLILWLGTLGLGGCDVTAEARRGTVDTPLKARVSVRDYAELRQYSGDASAVVITSTAIAGVVMLDRRDSVSRDDGGSIIVDSRGRRWKRLVQGEVPLRWFEPAADGRIEDTKKIQAAIAAAEGHNAVLILENGSNYLSGPLKSRQIRMKCYGNATLIAQNGVAEGEALITADDVGLEGVTIDGRYRLGRLIQVSQRYTQRRSSLRNVRGSTKFFGRLIYAKATVISFDIDQNCYFEGVSGVENGIIGDTPGADCGIYLEGPVFVIRDSVFRNIGGYEDGDCIRIQLPADQALLWGAARGSRVEKCQFIDIKKRAVKCMASYVDIVDNVITSSATDENLCPYAAIDLYGSYNSVEKNKVRLSRSVSGIIDNGKGNVIRMNDVVVSADSSFRSARSSATSVIRNERSQGGRVEGNTVSGKTEYIFFVNRSAGTNHSDNTIVDGGSMNHSAIYVSGGDNNAQSANQVERKR